MAATPTKEDLSEKAKETGIQFYLPWFSTLNWRQDTRGVLLPASAFQSAVTEGYGVHGVGGFNVPLSEPELYSRADPRSLVQLPWDPEVGWIAW